MAKRNPYKFYTKQLGDGRIKTIAVSTYAGQTVRGTTICDLNDQYDEAIGRNIAATRCAAKIAQKRLNRAVQKKAEAERMVERAKAHLEKMSDYYGDALVAQVEAAKAVNATFQ